MANIEFDLTAPPPPDSWLIYKIDSELGDGAVVPNRGSYTLGDDNMYLVDINSPNGQITATSAVGPFSLSGPSANYYTILLRAGDIATLINAAQVAPPDGATVQVSAETGVWLLYAQGGVSSSPYQQYRTEDLLADLSTSADPDSNTTLMATIDAFGGTGSFRVVTVSGGVVSNWTTLSPVFSPGSFGSIVRLQKAFGYIVTVAVGLWSQSWNGLGMWKEQCVTDADFLRLYNQWVAA